APVLPTKSITYAYWENGQIEEQDGGRIVDETFAYDELNRLKTWTHTTGGASGPTFRREYAYNDFGDMTGTKTFDSATGTTPSAQQTYTFGVTSPRTIPSAVKTDDANTYTYDSLGRRKTRTPTGGSVETTTYSHWNLPTS